MIGLLGTARAWIALVGISLRRQLWSKKTLLCLVVLAVTVAIVFAAGARQPLAMRPFVRFIVLRAFGLFFLPAVAVAFGSGALADERDDRTLVYLVTRPLARWSIYVAKYVAVLPIAAALTMGGLWCVCWIASLGGKFDSVEAFRLLALPTFLTTTAYLALFHFFGAAVRHATLVSAAYAFFIEVFVGRMPGILKRVSVSFYDWSMIYDATAGYGVRPPKRAVFLPIDGDVAQWVLIGVTVGFIVLGAVWFARREFRDPV